MVRPKKHLGQHFLRDENIARKITGCLSADTENLLEIGPGKGILTRYLINSRSYNFKTIEIDQESVNYLITQYPEYREKIIQGDFLKIDLEKLFKGRISVIGNFPYNISSQILFKVLENRNKIQEVVGMFQKEVAERISSESGSRKYGIISVLVQAYYEIEYLFTVNENVFFPKPAVKSAVIKLKRNQVKKLNCDESLFKNIVKAGFNQRRKTLRNSLKNFNFNQPESLGVILSQRAEQLSVNDFVFLTQNVDIGIN